MPYKLTFRQIRQFQKNPFNHPFWVISCKLMWPPIWFCRRYVNGKEECSPFFKTEKEVEDFIEAGQQPTSPERIEGKSTANPASPTV